MDILNKKKIKMEKVENSGENNKGEFMLFKKGKLKSINLSLICFKQGDYYSFGSSYLGIFGNGYDEIEARTSFELMIEEIFDVNIEDIDIRY